MADRIFIDTNVLAFANNTLSAFHRQAQLALQQYYQSSYELWVNRQVIREYLSVMSRNNPDPVKVVTPAILSGLQNLIAGFRIADENELVTTHLFSLLSQFPCGGKQIHDANIVATMQAYGISSLLTHNVADFTRFASIIQVIPL